MFLGAELAGATHAGAPACRRCATSPAPICAKLMNRMNFGKRSGVVLDSCAKHGTWFDADELRRVVEFVRDGGLDRARAIEKEQLEEERRLLVARKTMASWGAPQPPQGKETSPEATAASPSS